MRTFLAVSTPTRATAEVGPTPAVTAHLGAAGSVQVHTGPDGWVAIDGAGPDDQFDETSGGFAIQLGRAARARAGDVSTAALAAMLGDGTGVDSAGLTSLLPPFAAAARSGAGRPIVTGADWLGFRQLFWWQGNGVAAISTSARALAALAGANLDPAFLGMQSIVGWQIGTGTVFTGVRKLSAGAVAVLQDGRVTEHRYVERELPADPVHVDSIVAEMAEILQSWLEVYLTDHPDAVLQLTGGHDSRILLGAIPRSRRSGLQALTLDAHGGADARIAARLCAAYGMRHQVHRTDEQRMPTPREAHELAVEAAGALECMASSLALAPLLLAERNLDQGHRISGLGGEVARGFYYAGQPQAARTSARLIGRLAQWRLFANEAVESSALEPDFDAAARSGTLALLNEVFSGYSADWLRATDDFYLYQRMHRWAGAHGTVAAVNRYFINPMFDRRFLALALAAAPGDKRDSRLLGRLMVRLDPELARIRLDSGLVPDRLARQGPGTHLANTSLTLRKGVRKVRQRLTSARRPQFGAAEHGALVVAHWRAAPDTVAPLSKSPVVRQAWLEQLLDGRHEAEPTTIAFLVNLLVALSAAE